MQVLNGTHLIFKTDDDEQITVKITPKSPGDYAGVTYSFNRDNDAKSLPQGQDIIFLPEANKVTILRVFFHFKTNGVGAFYDVEITGSQGGNFNEPRVNQAGSLVPGRRHTFIADRGN